MTGDAEAEGGGAESEGAAESEAESEAEAEFNATEPEPRPKKKRRYLRLAAEIGLVLVIYLGFRAYQQRDTPGGPAPVLSAVSIEGAELAVLPTDEPVLVHFWATWCGVCQAEEDNIDSVASDHRVITVASQSGTAGDVSTYLREHELSFPVVNDPTGALAQEWGVHAFPTSFVVDPDGQIRHVEIGYTSTFGLRARLWLAGF